MKTQIVKEINTIGYISVTDRLPKNSERSKYFSDVLMVIEGNRKLRAVFQTERKQFYRYNDNLGREDCGKIYPQFWKYL